MARRFTVGALIASVFLILGVLPAMAAPPLALHIQAPSSIATDPDPFTASGPAVTAGLVCPAGQVTDLSVVITSSSPHTRILHVRKHFVCDDGSGTFDARLVVKLDLATNATKANWKIIAGTDSYVGLRGSGKLVGTPIIPGVSIDDVYDGKVK